MTGKRRPGVDKVRASRDGHEFHEAWAARKATQLLWPDGELTGIAVEGLSPTDQAQAPAKAVEIADLTLYYGGACSFEQAARTIVAQFKYSVADSNTDFRATDAKKTIKKFAATFRHYSNKFGANAVQGKLEFQLITNRPISDSLSQAVDALARKVPQKGAVKAQAQQLQKASGLTGKRLTAFAQKLQIIGGTGSLPQNKDAIASLVVDWSATSDTLAAARLGKLMNLVRDKAGCAGTDRNLIMRTDILAAFQVADPKDLLPCESALVDVGQVLEREQLSDALNCISTMSRPLLIHSTGGIGKTVFMATLATKLTADHEVVLFDCFGGGAYRSPEDARHLPKRGLIHIVNTLAFRGLCDPVLPDSADLQTLLSTFRRRIAQCKETLSRINPSRNLAILIDAIDNADFAARQRGEDCFPVLLLQSLHTAPLPDVKVIVSCRTERKPQIHAACEEFELRPFTKRETTEFLRTRVVDVSDIEVNVAYARTGGNPRVLDYLLTAGRGLLDESETNKKIELNDLLQKRIDSALAAATARGHSTEDTNAFLAGLAILPPPVPLDEYACAHSMTVQAVESFASDLHPLLERTRHGLMFRDEPTETLVQQRYASSVEALRPVAANLNSRQGASVYAARALPGLLLQLDDGNQLVSLAFDDRIPSAITSTVGRRNVRYARLKAATLHAALKKDYNNLTRLLVELSTVAAVDQRGVDYLLDHPDLVVAAQDVDATRRLFETRTAWPGKRHARMAIAHILSGDIEEGARHAYADDEWIEHDIRNRQEGGTNEPGPERTDIAAIPFLLISQGRCPDATRYLSRWLDWYTFEVCELVFAYSHLAQTIRSDPPSHLISFVDSLSGVGPLAAALSFQPLSHRKRRELVIKLSRCCRKATELQLPDSYYRKRSYNLQDGLRKSAAIGLSLGLSKEAIAISSRAPHRRPSLWSYRDAFLNHDVFPFLSNVAMSAAARKEIIHEIDLLPEELVSVCARIGKNATGKVFCEKAKEAVAACARSQQKDGTSKDAKENADHNNLTYETRQDAERFLAERLSPLLTLARAFSAVLRTRSRGLDKAFCEFLRTWEDSSKSTDTYRPGQTVHFFRWLGLQISLFILWSRFELGLGAIKTFLTTAQSQNIGVDDLVRVVTILAHREPLKSLAGEEAQKARMQIEREDEVARRASLFGALGRAMLPASVDEATVYFRAGLEQMDAIGSGDYHFVDELLTFASRTKGNELDERDFHTLTNICELNLGDEPEKFFWGTFGRGLSKVSGLRGLAKLSRWDDRLRIDLDNTLLPYLTGLLEAGKIGATDALALNRLANPVEYWFAGTKEFGAALRRVAGPHPAAITELINQFRDDNPNMRAGDTVDALASLAKEALGLSSEVTRDLVVAHERHTNVRDTLNERNNHNHTPLATRKDAERRNRKNKHALMRIAAATDPNDEASLVEAIDDFNALGNMYELKGEFFQSLRAKVPYSARATYVQNVARLENLYYYWKFAELGDAKLAWQDSSAALADLYRSLACSLVNAHASDLIDNSRLVASSIKELSDLTGVAVAELVVELIKRYARPDCEVSGAAWMAFASWICHEADEGQGQQALKRLLTGDAAKLADNVADGMWAEGCYPTGDFADIAAGLIWRILGSPYAEKRWRAAHCLRAFARFGRWDVIGSVVKKIEDCGAGPFQAPELPFFHLHARLWLLIALARMARDYPAEISRYADKLWPFVLDDVQPHVLLRHFAAKTLLACIDGGGIKATPPQMARLQVVNLSPHPRLKKKIRGDGGFYSGRPDSAPQSSFQFHLDYDFHKHDVDSLGQVFGQPCWRVADLMSEIVHGLEPKVAGMHDSPGRESFRERNHYEISSRYHTHGQQLGWHALFFSAGMFLRDHPITDDWWYEADPWGEWLRRYLLTRNDGLWLSDGADRTPLDTSVLLLESKKDGLAVTGRQDKVLGLAGIGSIIGEDVVVEGQWYSADDIRVDISSSLVPHRKAANLARHLTREEPFGVWVPCFDAGEDAPEFLRGEKYEYVPWIVCPSGESRLDEHDPYGVSYANVRPYLARDFAALCSLSQEDPFGRLWKDSSGRVGLRSQAWGRNGEGSNGEPRRGLRLFCSSWVLERVLTEQDKDLLVLVNLQRYQKGSYSLDSTWTNTVAVIRIMKSLEFEYFKGKVNHQHALRY